MWLLPQMALSGCVIISHVGDSSPYLDSHRWAGTVARPMNLLHHPSLNTVKAQSVFSDWYLSHLIFFSSLFLMSHILSSSSFLGISFSAFYSLPFFFPSFISAFPSVTAATDIASSDPYLLTFASMRSHFLLVQVVPSILLLMNQIQQRWWCMTSMVRIQKTAVPSCSAFFLALSLVHSVEGRFCVVRGPYGKESTKAFGQQLIKNQGLSSTTLKELCTANSHMNDLRSGCCPSWALGDIQSQGSQWNCAQISDSQSCEIINMLL